MLRNQSWSVIVVVVAVALSATAITIIQAASIEGGLAAQRSARLMSLVRLINERAAPSVEEVVGAYKDYEGLYERQANLIGSTNEESLREYEQISAILETPGLDDIAEFLFAPFRNVSASLKDTQKIGPNLQREIYNAIKQFSS